MRNQWQALVHAGGLGMTFRNWIAKQRFPYFPADFTDREWLSKAHDVVLQEAQALSRPAWSDKQQKMKQRLQSSFGESGARLAFQRINKESLPELNVLFRKISLDLEQQRWEADGNEVVLVRNVQAFAPDDSFRCKSGRKSIIAVLRNRLVFDSKLSVDEARSIQKLEPLPNPCDIANDFFNGWNSYWCRDSQDEPPPAAFQQWCDSLPGWDPMSFQPISFEEWQFSLKRANLSP